jgi:hypothetical protein
MSLQAAFRQQRPHASTVAAALAITFCVFVTASAPAMATTSGVLSGFALTPTSTAAASDPNITTTIGFHYATSGDSVKNITSTLPPGMLAGPADVPQVCSASELAAMSCPAGSLIGSGTVMTSPNIGAVTTNLYVTPASGSEAAGIGAVIYYAELPGHPVAVGTGTGALGLALVGGKPVGELKVFKLPNNINNIPLQIDSLTLTINGKTSAGTPFTRLPTSCAPATTTISVDTYSAAADGSGSDTFTPTGCSSLRYTPTLSATAVKDRGDSGVAVTTVVSQPQALTQAAGEATTLSIPTAMLAPNPGLVLLACGNADPATCPASSTVGSVTARTPLLSAPLAGRIVVVKTASGVPGLTIILTSPITVELPGVIAFNAHDVLTTFASLPDIPLTDLTVSLTGGKNAAFQTSCETNTGSIGGSFTGQNGVRVTSAVPVKVSGCKAQVVTGKPPKLSAGALTGVASGMPKLGFKLTAGSNSPKLSSFTFSLPSGLKLNATQLSKGLKLGGGKLKSAKVKQGKLVVSLKSAASSISVTLGGKAMTASHHLIKSVKSHKLKAVALRVKVTETTGKSTTLRLTITKLS